MKWLLLLLSLVVTLTWAEVRPVSSLDLPMMMPVNGADTMQGKTCLLYTSDAADDLLTV